MIVARYFLQPQDNKQVVQGTGEVVGDEKGACLMDAFSCCRFSKDTLRLPALQEPALRVVLGSNNMPCYINKAL